MDEDDLRQSVMRVMQAELAERLKSLPPNPEPFYSFVARHQDVRRD